jgi:hypothetical protein
MLPAPLQFIVAMIAYAINQRMARQLDYLQEEVRVLKEALAAATGKTRIDFSAEQRRLWWRNTRFPRNFASAAVGASADAGRMSDATKVRVEVQRGRAQAASAGPGPWPGAKLGAHKCAPTVYLRIVCSGI